MHLNTRGRVQVIYNVTIIWYYLRYSHTAGFIYSHTVESMLNIIRQDSLHSHTIGFTLHLYCGILLEQTFRPYQKRHISFHALLTSYRYSFRYYHFRRRLFH